MQAKLAQLQTEPSVTPAPAPISTSTPTPTQISTPTPTAATVTAPIPVDFGPNVLIFDPSMAASAIQTKVDNIFRQQESNHFASTRYALIFKPGYYNATVKVGFFTQVLGLGQLPDDVTINGTVQADARWFNGNATQNFWRGVENMAVIPSGGTERWAVSQAAPFRRMHVRGNLILDDGGWSSGGFLSDSKIDNQINSGGQQQWFTRNSQIGNWNGSNWNMVFLGVTNAPSGASWPNPPNTVVSQTPIIREKPFLTFNNATGYSVFVPALRSNTQGTSWGNGGAAGESISIDQFYIAKQGIDTASTINSALRLGKHLIFAPGVYRLNETIRVTRANTVVLGLGLATLVSDNGVNAMSIADVDGVKIAGLLFDAGRVNSQILLEVGPTGSSADHSTNPTSLHDIFFRIGGGDVGKASVSLKINSNNTIGDHFWIWRADHGVGDTVGWYNNTTANGLIVNGTNVTIYGLFVEHYHQYQTVWNGNGGRVYFYQSEIPYDVPNQQSWMNGGVNGFASYKVGNSVTTHEAWGLGIYCYFSSNPSVKLENAIEAPRTPGVKFHNMTTVSLGGVGEITHVYNYNGNAAAPWSQVSRLGQ
ncbi:MAG: coagulation factor 5/8 type domain-containing protein [Pseudomonadota bacterium]